MRRGKVHYRIRLGGVDVCHADGEVVRIPWTELHGSCSELQPSAVARMLDPRLPKRLRLPCGIGWGTIRTLRVQAAERALRAGTYDRFWKAGPPPRFSRVMFVTALALMVLAGAVAVTWHSQFASLRYDSPGDWAEITRIWQQRVALPLVCGAVVTFVLGLIGRLGERGATLLAFRDTARGIEYHYDDGRTVFRSWDEAARLRRDWPSKRRFVSISARRAAPRGYCWDYEILRTALQRWRHPDTVRRGTGAQAARANWCAAPLLSLFFMALFGFIGLSDYLDPETALARGRQPLTLLQTTIAAAGGALAGMVMVTLLQIGEFGIRRAILRPLRRMLGLRSAARSVRPGA